MSTKFVYLEVVKLLVLEGGNQLNKIGCMEQRLNKI